MSELLARLARTLTHRWKRSLLVAVLVIVALMGAASQAGQAVDDFTAPGTETQQAIDLLKAHTPALAGVDSTLVFSVEDGKISDPQPRAAVEGALAKVRALNGVAQVGDPFAEGGTISPDGRLASVDVRYTLDPSEVKKEDGVALLEAAETASATASTSPPAAC